MGLLVSVFRSSLGDCTGNGISCNETDLLLINVEGPIDNDHPDYKKALLVHGNCRGLVKIVPARRVPDGWVKQEGWWMMGGNYASTSDGRFHDAVRKITGAESYGAVPIHDRFES